MRLLQQCILHKAIALHVLKHLLVNVPLLGGLAGVVVRSVVRSVVTSAEGQGRCVRDLEGCA